MYKKINYKELMFCREYLKDYNGLQAAVRAGYAKSSAGTMACGLLKDPKILKYIEREMEKRCERLEVDYDWVLSELIRHYKTDLSKFLKIDGTGSPVVDFSKCTVEDLSVIDEITIEEFGTDATKTKIKLPTKMKILETIGKHVNVQAFKDKIEHSGAVELHFDKQDEEA